MTTTENASLLGYNMKIYLMQWGGGELTFGGRGFF